MSSSNPSRYSSSSTTTTSPPRAGQQPPFKPSSQPPLQPTHPTSHPDDSFSLAMPGIDPLTFFLTPPTPAPYPEDDDTTMLDFDYFDFDAGIISDPKHRPNSPDSIRSVSPSSLAGFARPPTPPKSAVSAPDLEFDYGSLGASPESDTVMEEYYRHQMGGYGGVPLLLKDFTNNTREKKKGKFTKGERHYGHHHVWREPSPDVYSIEEEPMGGEMERSDMGSEVGVGQQINVREVRAKGVDIVGGKGAKGKRVRFVLPGEEGVY